MKEIVIFCQAPADVQYALSIYHENKGKADISIFVTNVYGIYRFLKSLKLELKKLIFLPYYAGSSIKKLLKLLQMKYRLSKIYEAHFGEIANARVYFFSHFSDWMAFSLIARLATKNDIYFIDHYDKDTIKGFVPGKGDFKDTIKLIVYQYITNTKLRWLRSVTGQKIEFLYYNYGIRRKEASRVDEKIYKLYSYTKGNLKSRSVLLFDGNHSSNDSIVNYDEIISRFADALTKKGFHIYVKPHPRLGYSKILDNCNVDVLPSYVPGEFIDGTEFLAIIGVETVATAKFARNNESSVYSIIDLFEFRDEEVKKSFKEYLISQSEGKIMFASSVGDIVRGLS